MNKEELQLKIQIVLDQEESLINQEHKTFKQEDDAFITYDNAKTLIDLFYNLQSDEELKTSFISYLQERYSPLTLALRFFILVKLEYKQDSLDLISNNNEIHSIYSTIFSLIDLMIQTKELISFDIQELYDLKTNLADLNPSSRYLDTYMTVKVISHKTHLLRLLTQLNYDSIRDEIKGINIEINNDKETVKEIITFLNFDDKYNQLLTEIDTSLHTDSEVETSGMIGNLRAFFEDLINDLASRIASEEGEKIPKYEGIKSKVGRSREHLRIKLELSDEDNNFIDAFIQILHSEGGHSFTSNKDYFRLARNIGIEIVLYILSKYKEKFPTE